MPHYRSRYLQNNILQALKYSPLVGVLGHRQVGKTTFLQHISDHYLTFDDEKTLSSANKNISKFVAHLNKTPTVIDESQMLPKLFPALKERVRKDKRPGQVILSGSVRFSSRKAIRESLTGRILNLELLPFSISEIKHKSLPNSLLKLNEMGNLDSLLARHELEIRNSLSLRKEIDTYLQRGGLPGIFFVRENSIRAKKIDEQLSLMLDRDLRMIHQTSLPYQQILDFVRYLAKHEGLIYKYSEAQKAIKISEATQKHLLYALEAIFLIRQFRVDGGRKGHLIYFEDQAEVAHLLDENKKNLKLYEGFLFRHLRTQLAYRLDHQYRFFSFLTRGKARVPIAVEIDRGSTLGFIVIEGDSPTLSEKASASSFLKHYAHSKIVYVSLTVKKAEVMDSRSILSPMEWWV